MLLAHPLNAMRYMLLICEQFAVDFDVMYNSRKSVAMRIGSRHSISCAPLQVAGIDLKYVTSLKYLGLCILAASCFKCLVEHLKIKFYRVFNCIFSKSRAANSEMVTTGLLKSYCLPFLTWF